MTAQPAVGEHEPREDQMLDADTSAAVLRWMETTLVPDGLDRERWEQWVEDGCHGCLELNGVALTPAMLGRWARTGTLR